MDINAIAGTLKDSTTLEIVHPVTGEGGWILELASPQNAEGQSKINAILDRTRKKKATTVAQDEKDGIALICARVLGWTGLKSGDAEVPYSPETCITIMSAPTSFWIRSQVLDALGDATRPFQN